MNVLIRYRIRADAVSEHLELLNAVFAELAAVEPPGVRWESFRLADGVSFVDLVTVEAPGSFSKLRSWAAYRGTLDDRCDEPVRVTDLEHVAGHPAGSHGTPSTRPAA